MEDGWGGGPEGESGVGGGSILSTHYGWDGGRGRWMGGGRVGQWEGGGWGWNPYFQQTTVGTGEGVRWLGCSGEGGGGLWGREKGIGGGGGVIKRGAAIAKGPSCEGSPPFRPHTTDSGR